VTIGELKVGERFRVVGWTTCSCTFTVLASDAHMVRVQACHHDFDRWDHKTWLARWAPVHVDDFADAMDRIEGDSPEPVPAAWETWLDWLMTKLRLWR
jgi:hypothetical protein